MVMRLEDIYKSKISYLGTHRGVFIIRCKRCKIVVVFVIKEEVVMLLIKLIAVKLLGYKKGQFVAVFLFSFILQLLLGVSVGQAIIASSIIGVTYLLLYNVYFIKAGNILDITKYSHKICMRMENIPNTKNCDIEKMFLDDFNNLKNIKKLAKWKIISTTTHTVIAHELVNRILTENNQKTLTRKEFVSITSRDIPINKYGQDLFIKIKKKKNKRINFALVFKYNFSELKNAIKVNAFSKKDFYDIEIDVKLLYMSNSKYKFERLTPTNDVNLDIYDDAINYVFANSDVRNIALSGAYSAGKSSILASYKKKHSDLRFLHISLTHYNTEVDEDKTKVKESVLEGKILNQLIHQIMSDKIPQTNFRVKKTIKSKSIIKKTLEAVSLLVAVVFFTCFSLWKGYVLALPNNWLKSILILSTHQYTLMIDGLIIIGLVFVIIFGLIKIQKNKNVFRKLNLQGNEIEIFEESDDSYFDKYLNEVLYLFENADADVIVFEDMDRFNASKIFERLREVNTLANIQLLKENKKTLRFLYLLRDDIFASKDRTKFFDYIIPVVPVIDSSNSYDQFISLFKKCGLFEKFDESFIQGLSLYIDDMRLLKNIYNEFLIYYNRLNITELDCNKMLAIIAYKNLFPRDFGDLQLNQGMVYAIFNLKEQLIEDQIVEIKKSIKEKEKKIASLENLHIKSRDELNVILAHKYLKNYNWKNYDENQLEEFVSNHLNGNNEYSFRQQELTTFLNTNFSEVKKEISKLNQELITIKNNRIHQIFTRYNINKIFSVTSTNEIGKITDYNDIKSSEYFDLLKYLIRNGYIDETYADYMTYFYENSLSRIDKTFLRSVTDRKAKEYTYQLKNPQLVISRLRLVDFDQEEILNFDLLTYLLSTMASVEYLERFIDQLKDTKNFKFIGAFLDMTTDLPSYIKYLNTRWPEAFKTALNEKALTEEQIRTYSICSIYYSDDTTMELINKDNYLSDYISNTRDYLAIKNPKIEKLIHGFTLLKVCFRDFDYDELNKSLFHAVYKESLYEINSENLQLIQREILGIKNDEDIFYRNYTLLSSYPDSSICQYVNQNISKYFDVVLQICGGSTFDNENAVIEILNNTSITTEQKHSYIHSLKTVITSINKIKDNYLWTLLLDADLVLFSEQNIIDYFIALKSLDTSIVSYINRSNIELDFSKIEYTSESEEVLFDCVVVCNSIENLKYKQILVSLKFYYTDFNISNIMNDKISILIDSDIIRMSAETLVFMREEYPNQNMNFIQKDINKYVEIMDRNLFSLDELLEIITWDISNELKIELLKFTDDEISIIGMTNYSPAVCLHILNNNFMESDLSNLFKFFEQWDPFIQQTICDLAISNIFYIINNPKLVSEKLKDKLIHSEQLNRDVKIDFLIALIPDFNENSIKEVLAVLELTDYIRIFDKRSRPKFEINDENEKLLSAFKDKGLINNYEESAEKEGYYKIIR
jgi:hypothetical protein